MKVLDASHHGLRTPRVSINLGQSRLIRLPVLPSSVREMAMSTTPLHNYGGDEFKWVNKFEAPKFDLWGKIGVEKPKTPRRM